jgi:hypothetical protein
MTGDHVGDLANRIRIAGCKVGYARERFGEVRSLIRPAVGGIGEPANPRSPIAAKNAASGMSECRHERM